MICEQCGLDMRVVGSRNAITGDKSPDEATRLFTVLTLMCKNKQCSAYGRKIEILNEQPVAKAETAQESGE